MNSIVLVFLCGKWRNLVLKPFWPLRYYYVVGGLVAVLKATDNHKSLRAC